jgi:hypothetical protein
MVGREEAVIPNAFAAGESKMNWGWRLVLRGWRRRIWFGFL